MTNTKNPKALKLIKAGISFTLLVGAILIFAASLSGSGNQEMLTRETIKQDIPIGTPEKSVVDRLGEPTTRDGDMWVYHNRLIKTDDPTPHSLSVFFNSDREVRLILFEHR